MKILAAIPCFNTAGSIAGIVSSVSKFVSWVVVIDDGSTDNTISEARSAGAFVISHRKNEGYGAAISSCFKVARDSRADILVIIDGDGQHNPEDIPNIVKPILERNADLVIGSRFLKNDNAIAIPGYRWFGIRVINWLFNLGSRGKVSDTQSGFRAYSRNMINSVTVTDGGMAASIEILEIARKLGAVIRETPISCKYFSSKISILAIRHGLGVAVSVLRIRLWLLLLANPKNI